MNIINHKKDSNKNNFINKIKDKITNIFSKINDYINSFDFLNNVRESEKDFTRNRKMPFPTLLMFILNFRNKSSQAELNNFYNNFFRNEIVMPDKSAFFKARLKIKYKGILKLVEKVSDFYYKADIAKKWNNFRLVAIDGSTITIPLTGNKKLDEKLIQEFGSAKNQIDDLKVIQAHGQILYDPLNKIILTGKLSSTPANERMVLSQQLSKLKSGDLLLLDRGFPALWIFKLLNHKQIDYVIRIQRGFLTITDNLFNSKELDKVIEIEITKIFVSKYPDLDIKPGRIKLRLVKVFLDSGEVEVLATSLINQKTYANNIFKELYFMRWGIETTYDHLKNKLQLEWFSGKTVKVIYQDFYAKLFQKNLFTLISISSSEKLKEETQGRKYEYAINENIAYGILKYSWIKLLTNSINQIMNILKRIIKMILKYLEPIRKGRNYPRIKKKKSKTTIISFANRIAI